MITKQIIFFILFISTSTVYGMEHTSYFVKATQPSPTAMADKLMDRLLAEQDQQEFTVWSLLPNEILTKIFACADLATKEKIYFTCPNTFSVKITDIIMHSLLVLPRKCHIYHMVETARRNDTVIFINLLCNAINCDHDICNTVSYFLLNDSTELQLLNRYAKHNDTDTLEQLLPYIMAVYRGDATCIDQFLVKNMHHPENRNGMNPLIVSAHYNFPQTVNELLLTQNISLLNMPAPDDGYTPLNEAVREQNIETCRFLLSFKEIDVNIPDNDGITPLAWATCNNDSEMVTLLLAHGAHVNTTSKLYGTPLHTALHNNFQSITTLLLQHPEIKIREREKEMVIAFKKSQEKK